MTTTESISYEDARNLLIATASAHGVDGEIGTPTTCRRNYSLAEALACAAICENFRTEETNGITILTGTNTITGNHRWYIDNLPRPFNPWA